MIYPENTMTRGVMVLDGVWDLALETENTSQWENGFTADKKVAVPSSFNDLYTEFAYKNHCGGAWFQRRFRTNQQWKDQRVVLRFGSATYRASVYVNGELMGHHETGYTPFEFDITQQLRWDEENLLVVRIDQQLSPETIPQGNLVGNQHVGGQFTGQFPDTPFDFFPYSGLHRSVVLYSTDSEVWFDSFAIHTSADGDTGLVDVTSTLQGTLSNETSHQLKITVEETGATTSHPLSDLNCQSQLKIEKAKLWDIGQPNLYHLKFEICAQDGTVIDQVTQKVGIRSLTFDGKTLSLNGKPVYFQGFGKHEDFPIIGKGHNNAVAIRDFELLQWIGANSFRTSHYPYAEEILDLADAYGILVISEVPAVSLNIEYANDKTLQTHLQTLRELVARDRNHPSVVMWSVANEPKAWDDKARQYFEAIAKEIKSLDDTRPSLLVTCHPTQDVSLDLFDIIGWNTYQGWYSQCGDIELAIKMLDKQFDDFHKRYPDKSLFITEFGADCIAGYHSLPAMQWTEDYQDELVMRMIEVFRSKDYCIGEHLWNFADFSTGQNFVRVLGNKKGIFTRERQPKQVAHSLRKKWTPAYPNGQ